MQGHNPLTVEYTLSSLTTVDFVELSYVNLTPLSALTEFCSAIVCHFAFVFSSRGEIEGAKLGVGVATVN